MCALGGVRWGNRGFQGQWGEEAIGCSPEELRKAFNALLGFGAMGANGQRAGGIGDLV